ncbi:MAG: hypothetical protein A4E19_03615 [Nitrospira sp. SG-bin1]|nr:MAG: hypothetical protein A4E19_03615 [Nitrospira sp. SG-bin1]
MAVVKQTTAATGTEIRRTCTLQRDVMNSLSLTDRTNDASPLCHDCFVDFEQMSTSWFGNGILGHSILQKHLGQFID